MWDFFETVRHRHSVRKYLTDRPVEEQKLHAVLEAACAAPSAGDLQSYRMVVVTDPGKRATLARATQGQTFLAEAPVCLVVCADPARAEAKYGDRGRRLYAVQDATIAAAYAQLAAVAAGLASAWVGHFDEREVALALGLPGDVEPVALLSIGYPGELPEATPRRLLRDVVDFK